MTTQREFAVPMGVQEGEAKATAVTTAKVGAAAEKAKAHTVYKTRAGQRVPGVTTILKVLNKPALVGWANRLGLEGIEVDSYVHALADVGTIAHAMIHEYLTGQSFDRRLYAPALLDLAENSFLKWLEWGKGRTFRTILSEQPLVSERYQYGGTIDWYGEVDGQREVLDFKSGSAIYDEHVYQVCAYKQLLVEHGYAVDAVRVLQIGRDETEGFGQRRVTETAPYWSVFEHALGIYRLQQQLRKGR